MMAGARVRVSSHKQGVWFIVKLRGGQERDFEREWREGGRVERHTERERWGAEKGKP